MDYHLGMTAAVLDATGIADQSAIRTTTTHNGGTLRHVPRGSHVSGNPSGRPKGITYPGDYLRGKMGRWSKEQLLTYVNAPNTLANKVIAAKKLLRGMGYNVIDGELVALNPDIAERASDALMDRTEGKPGQRITVAQAADVNPEALLARIKVLSGGTASALTAEQVDALPAPGEGLANASPTLGDPLPDDPAALRALLEAVTAALARVEARATADAVGAAVVGE